MSPPLQPVVNQMSRPKEVVPHLRLHGAPTNIKVFANYNFWNPHINNCRTPNGPLFSNSTCDNPKWCSPMKFGICQSRLLFDNPILCNYFCNHQHERQIGKHQAQSATANFNWHIFVNISKYSFASEQYWMGSKKHTQGNQANIQMFLILQSLLIYLYCNLKINFFAIFS